MSDSTVRVLENELKDAKFLIYHLVRKLGGEVTVENRDIEEIPLDAKIDRFFSPSGSVYRVNV